MHIPIRINAGYVGLVGPHVEEVQLFSLFCNSPYWRPIDSGESETDFNFGFVGLEGLPDTRTIKFSEEVS